MTATLTASEMLFRRTGGDDFPDYVKAMISGPPKSGKTSFLGTVPNIVIADTEPHANNLQSVAHKNLPYVTINSTHDLHRLLMVLGDPTMRAKAAEQMGMPVIEAVSIDTIDTLQKIMKKERMREQHTSKFLRDDWGWLKDELTAILTAFTSLPMHVFFVVHIKTKDIGNEDDPQTIILPGLEGGLAEDIGGMVGYSLLSFRKEELRPDGTKFTKYWLRAEGDETYQYLGNRAAGRLPDVIEPNFASVYAAVTAGRAQIPTPVQPAPFATQPPAPPVAPPAAAPVAPAAPPAPAAEVAGRNPAHPPAAPDAPAASVNGAATASPPPAVDQGAQAKPDDNEPITANALVFTAKVYEAVGLEFPEQLIRSLNIGQARQLVRMWQAIQQDAVEGKLERAAADEMASYLSDMGWLADADKIRLAGGTPAPAPAAPAPVVADVSGTIEQVMAYVGDDLTRAQEAYDLEIAKPKPRATLLNTLVAKGVTVQTPVQTEPAAAPQPAPDAVVAEPAVAPNLQVVPAVADVEAQGTDDAQEQAATVLLQDELGAVPLDGEGKPMPCEECHGPVDDESIATLSKSRFNRRLCVTDYIAETKKS